MITFVLKISGLVMKKQIFVNKRNNFKIAISILLGLILATSGCGDGNSGVTKEYRLNNGLKLIVQPDRRSPVVINQIWYRVGSVYEPLDSLEFRTFWNI